VRIWCAPDIHRIYALWIGLYTFYPKFRFGGNDVYRLGQASSVFNGKMRETQGRRSGAAVAVTWCMTSEVRIIEASAGGWTVALGDLSLAGFYGPNARLMAESHRELLIAALMRDGIRAGMLQIETP
jgi:hypothetical protein